MWWMHASAIHGLHGKWRIAAEGIVILDRRLVMRVECSISVPTRILVLERFLVEVMFVVHLQLAHGEIWKRVGVGVSERLSKDSSLETE